MLTFNVTDVIGMLINFNEAVSESMNVRGEQDSGGGRTLQDDVNDLIANLQSLNDLIPNIINQVVSEVLNGLKIVCVRGGGWKERENRERERITRFWCKW